MEARRVSCLRSNVWEEGADEKRVGQWIESEHPRRDAQRLIILIVCALAIEMPWGMAGECPNAVVRALVALFCVVRPSRMMGRGGARARFRSFVSPASVSRPTQSTPTPPPPAYAPAGPSRHGHDAADARASAPNLRKERGGGKGNGGSRHHLLNREKHGRPRERRKQRRAKPSSLRRPIWIAMAARRVVVEEERGEGEENAKVL